MLHNKIAMAGAIALASTLSASAYAQERGEPYLEQRLPAPSHALELKVGSGYTQGFGNVAQDRTVGDVAGAGLGVDAEVDWRISRPWSVGVGGQYQEFSSAQNSSSRGFDVNVGGTYHFEPLLRGDPWVRFATGYRFLYENNPTSDTLASTVLRHGFEPIAAKIGYDVRVSEDVALAPVVGADLSVFTWETGSNINGHTQTPSHVATFIYAGVQGRFDIGGERSDPLVALRRLENVGVTAPQRRTEPPPLAAPPPAEEVKPVSPSIAVTEEVLRQCMLTVDGIEKAPKFDFDKSDLLPADIKVLKEIGDCFTTGALKGARMSLVGRADPRGTLEYNDALGMRRANRVSGFFEGLGIDAGRIDKASRGKRDAVGTDEASWAVDRRVDIGVMHH